MSLEQLVAALARKGIPLPFEMGTFLVLESCERIVTKPLLVSADGVWLSPEGEVMVSASQRVDDTQAAHALVRMLGELLVRSAPGVPPMLLELVERSAHDSQLKLAALRDALEATLVPLNRAATRRVLGRLLREARKEGERVPSMPAPDVDELDDELDALLGGGPVRAKPKPQPQASASAQPVQSPVPAAWRALEGDDELVEEAPRRKPKKAEVRREPEREAPELEAPTLRAKAPDGASKLLERGPAVHLGDDLGPSLSDMPVDGGSKRMTLVAIALVAIAVLLGGAYVGLGRERTLALLGMEDGMKAPPPPAASAPEPAAKPRYGELRVSSSPARAQVLLRIGKSPALAEGLPVGIAHELVAISDGRKVARDVVPADAAWTETNGALQYELALQLAEGKPGAERELGATRLPPALGTATGATGAVRVITSPPGATVYQLIGFTPDVRVENLEVATPAELLVYLSGYELGRVELTEQSYKLDGGRLVADLEVPLRALK